MAEASATFSESWYRVANLRISLRSSVAARRQTFRGERWIVLQNPLRNQYFRLRPAAYEFVARLRPDRTVEEVWKECLDRSPDDTPGQEAVIQLLAQLYHANLLQYDFPADAAQLFNRYQKARQRELQSRLLNIMFARFPLLDPDAFLARTLPWVGKLISLWGALIWLVVVGAGLKVVADHFPALRNQAQGIIDPGNLILLYAGLVLLKSAHEFGHAYFCRRFGGEVHAMGILLMVFTPIPYMDATSAWGFRERWKRVLVGAAGMIVELFFAAIAALVWANTGQGTLHGLAYNMMFIASVSTILFNLNPLLRFDGYYILSDLVGIPNLSQRANAQLRHAAERRLFGLKKEPPPAQTWSEAFWLSAYGIASGIYRIIVFGGILLIVADRFLLIGILMAAACAAAWVARPVIRLAGYLASSPKLERHRLRACFVTAILVLGTLGFLQFVPLPHHFRAPGILRSLEWGQVHNWTAGTVTRLVAQPGQLVEAGAPLLEMANRELDLEIMRVRAHRDEIRARQRQALQEAIPNLKPLESMLDAADQALRKLEADKAGLTVRATQTGIWGGRDLEMLAGSWLAKGAPLGLLVNPSGFRFEAIVRQEDVDRLFTQEFPGAEVRLHGQSGQVLQVSELEIIPGDRRNLPSAALGWLAGGPVATSPNDPDGTEAAEPFFEVHAKVLEPASAVLLHGRAGKIRFDLPGEPLLPLWIRSLRQLLQQRYQL